MQTDKERYREREKRQREERQTKDVQTEASFCHSSHRKSATWKQNMSSRKKAKIKATTLAKSDYSDAVIAGRFMRQSEPETCCTLGSDSEYNERQLGAWFLRIDCILLSSTIITQHHNSLRFCGYHEI